MDALRRLFGGGSANPARSRADESGDPDAEPPSADAIDAEERARELELLRAEQDRLDELVLRQQRYADRSWVPPPQGGPRRSDDGEASSGEDR